MVSSQRTSNSCKPHPNHNHVNGRHLLILPVILPAFGQSRYNDTVSDHKGILDVRICNVNSIDREDDPKDIEEDKVDPSIKSD